MVFGYLLIDLTVSFGKWRTNQLLLVMVHFWQVFLNIIIILNTLFKIFADDNQCSKQDLYSKGEVIRKQGPMYLVIFNAIKIDTQVAFNTTCEGSRYKYLSTFRYLSKPFVMQVARLMSKETMESLARYRGSNQYMLNPFPRKNKRRWPNKKVVEVNKTKQRDTSTHNKNLSYKTIFRTKLKRIMRSIVKKQQNINNKY